MRRTAAAMGANAVFIGATGQHVGKTTTCLGVVSALQRRFDNVTFMKPVGQKFVVVKDPDGASRPVDKDCIVFKDTFGLKQTWEHMSPVLLPPGFTRDFLDGKTTSHDLLARVRTSFRALSSSSDVVVVEGTGHTGVGAICNISNAHVAAEMGVGVVLVCLGGLGSSFDELALNRAMLKEHGVRLQGVVVNQIVPDKRDMIVEYFSKALKGWGVPLLGAIPFKHELRAPSIADLSRLLRAPLLSAEHSKLRHFSSIRLAVGFYDEFTPFDPVPNQLIVTHATRTDILAIIVRNHRVARSQGRPLCNGLIITGASSLPQHVVAALEECDIPCIAVANLNNDKAMLTYNILAKITDFTRKMDDSEPDRLRAAVDHVVKYLDMDALVASAGPWVGSRTLATPTGTRATTTPATALESTPAAAGTSASPSTQVVGAPVAPSLSASGVGGGVGVSQQSTGHVPAAGATGALFL